MQAYGSVAPNAALRSAGDTAQRQGKSNGSSFMAIVAGVLVLGDFVRRSGRQHMLLWACYAGGRKRSA
jgi:hypothetical protein